MRRFTPRETERLRWLVEEGYSLRSAALFFLNRSENSIRRKAEELGLKWREPVVGRKLTFRVPEHVFNVLTIRASELSMPVQRLGFILLNIICRSDTVADILNLRRDGGMGFDWPELEAEAEAEAARVAAKKAAAEKELPQKVGRKPAKPVTVKPRRKIPYAGKDQYDSTQW